MSALLEKLAPEQIQTGPDWLATARRRARKQLMKHGFPTLKTEDWKYTSLRALEKVAFEVAPPSDSPLQLRHRGEDECSSPCRPKGVRGRPGGGPPIAGGVLTWLNNTLIPPDNLPAGVRLTPFSALDEQHGRALVDRDFGGSEGAFAWLNSDQFEEGLLLEITEDQDLPLILAFQASEQPTAVHHPRLVVNVATGVRAQIVEWHESAGNGLLNIVMDTHLEAGAHLDYLRFQNASAEAFIIQRHDVRVDRDAGLDWTVLDLGGRLMRHDLNVDLAETGAGCNVKGAFVARGRGHLDHHTRVTHSVGQTLSREQFRGILADSGHGVFNGKIVMLPGADGSDSELHSANLLLSPDARIDTKPELEIHAEEVKAAHGATVGALDDTALFYMRSRGVPREQAVSLLKQAFVAEIIEHIEPETLREEFDRQLQEALEQ